MDSEEKHELADKMSVVLRKRLEASIEECALKRAFARVFDQFTIVHLVEGPECLANEMLYFLEKEELI